MVELRQQQHDLAFKRQLLQIGECRRSIRDRFQWRICHSVSSRISVGSTGSAATVVRTMLIRECANGMSAPCQGGGVHALGSSIQRSPCSLECQTNLSENFGITGSTVPATRGSAFLCAYPSARPLMVLLPSGRSTIMRPPYGQRGPVWAARFSDATVGFPNASHLWGN